MATVKVVLRKKQNKDGTYPLAIRITKDRKTSFVHLGYNLKESEWDEQQQRVKKSYPSSARLNNYIIKRLAEATNTTLELQTIKAEVSSTAIKQKIKPKVGLTFFAYAEVYLNALKEAGKFNRFSPDRSRLKQFKSFLGGADIAFSDINRSLLDRFQRYVKSELNGSDRTVANYLMVIRSVFSQAINDKALDPKYYPFGKGKVSIKLPESLKIGLTIEEVRAIEELKLPRLSRMDHARNLWLFSFYFAGMRASDVLRLRWSDFQNDRLFYAMGKNNKAGSLAIPAQAEAILRKYRRINPRHNLVFPDLECVGSLEDRFMTEKKINEKIKLLDQGLQEIAELLGLSKKLTMHIARHTFGNISGDRIPIQMLQKLYRHSSITTTIIYQSSFIHKEADDALRAVLSTQKDSLQKALA